MAEEFEKILGADNGNPPDSLRQMYPKINRNFDRVKDWFSSLLGLINGHIQSNTAHAAEHITYTGDAPGNNAKQAINNTYNRISEIVAQAGDDNTEIVDARGGYTVLGDRLNATDAQLADTVKKGDLFINVKDYGAFGDGVTDDTNAINLAEQSEGDTLYFPDGLYPINNIDTTKNWILSPGATILYNGSETGYVMRIVGTGKRYSNLKFDLQDKNPHYVIDIQGNDNHFDYIELMNCTYNGVQSANCGVHISGSNNTFDFIKGENFTQTAPGNESCPQVVALIDSANDNFIADIYSYNCRATVVNASTGTKNALGTVTCKNAHDNAVYTVRGGYTSCDCVIYDGDNECFVVISDSETPVGYKSSADVGRLIVNNCTAIVRANVVDYVNVGEVIGGGKIDFLLFTNNATGETGRIKFGNVLLNGNIHRLFYIPSARASFEELSVNNLTVYTEWKKSDGDDLGSFCDMSAAKSLYVGSLNLTFVDTENAISNGTRIYHLIAAALTGVSYFGTINFKAYQADKVTPKDVLLALTNVGQAKLTVTSGTISVGNNRIEIGMNDGNLNDALYATNPPTSGTWRFGQFIRNRNTSNNNLGWRCSVAGTPGTWVSV